jgi:ABC-type Mn2+/Zn2+ transport system ATPase subunit
MQEMVFPGFKFQKFSGGACPRTPLALRVLQPRSLFNLDPPLLSIACQEAVWLRRLLSDIQMKQCGPSTIFEDNQGAIGLSRNPKFHNRTKHIDISYHYVREQVNLNTVSVKYCPTEDMLADVMTKGVSKISFEKFRNKLGVIEID